MKSRVLMMFALIGAFLFPLSLASHAEDLGAIKQRMVKRIATIDSLKATGALGENNQGLLEVRATSDEAEKIAKEENADRSTVYDAIARQTGSNAAAVGQARAKQIAAGSAPGVWLQKEDGTWFRK